MNFHELKDVVMIYSSGPDGKPDYSWENAKISVWDSLEQREMDLVFTGSSKPVDDKHPGRIQFIVNRIGNDRLVTDAFASAIKKIFPNISEETANEYTNVFVKELVELKK